VKKIKGLNVQGVIPDELEAVEITLSKPQEAEPEFVELVGQISLRSLEKADRKRKQKQQQKQNKQQRRGQPPQYGQQQKGQQPQPRGPQRPEQRGRKRGD